MEPREPSPFAPGGSGLPDAARNLARTLDAATHPATAEAAALRSHLAAIALELAERWSREQQPVEGKRSFSYHRSLWTLREFAVSLAPPSPSDRPAIRVVLEAFCRQFLPGAIVALRPAGLAGFTAREQLGSFRERLAELDIGATVQRADTPEWFINVRYPQGERDSTLAVCSALGGCHRSRTDHVFTSAVAGPAYFFSLAVDLDNHRALGDMFAATRLCFIGELLEISGWLEHPRIGPLIGKWRQHFGFGADFLDLKILSKPMLQKMREAQEAFRSAPAGYSPSDFDRDWPPMFERLRAGLPPATPGGEGDVIAVLNAGWCFAQVHLDDMYTALGSRSPEDRYEARRTLNRLLAEAIEPARESATHHESS